MVLNGSEWSWIVFYDLRDDFITLLLKPKKNLNGVNGPEWSECSEWCEIPPYHLDQGTPQPQLV